MGHYRNTFRTIGNGSVDPDVMRPHFENYHAAEWESEGDGVLQFYSDDGLEYKLIVVHASGLGFVMMFDCRDLHTNRTSGWRIAVADWETLDRFERFDDLCYPRGCFLDAARAWEVVEDFLLDGTKPSNRVEWATAADIQWPADLGYGNLGGA